MGALATVVGTIATVAAVGALAMTAYSLDLQSRRESSERLQQRVATRISQQPYLRVDVAFANFTQDGFVPPQSQFVYGAHDFRLRERVEEELADLIAVPEDEDALCLTVWLTNLQVQPLGVADNVRAALLLSWAVKPDDVVSTRRLDLELAYLAPGQTTAIQLVAVRSDVDSLRAEVVDVNYRDMFDSDLRDAHGAMVMLYDEGIGVFNERRVNRYEKFEGAQPQRDGNDLDGAQSDVRASENLVQGIAAVSDPDFSDD